MIILILTVWSWEFKRQNNINFSEQQQHRMQQLQQTVFINFSKNTLYYQDSKVIAQKHEPFPKFRQQQILNEFELVDLHNKGKLGQTDIITYLSNKYQWINTNILGQLFKTMAWDPLDHTVTKQQFVGKYLSRQKKLYLDINGLKNYQNWMRTLQQIYINEMRISNPRVYFYVQVRGVNIYENSKHIQWMDLIVEYQDHQTRTNYEIEQALYNGNYPSFEIWLPARNNTFFLKFTFADSNNRQHVYGQAYFEKPIEERISRFQNIDLVIVKNGVKFGDCQVCVYAQPSMQKVGRELKQLRQKEHINFELVNEKVKQYEYLQFLWGIRHKYPHKISPLDVSWMLAVRMILLILIGVLGVVVHVLGRFQPLSIIITFLMLRSWEFVLLRHQKFFLLWITVASILLDIAWISISSGFDSQITYTNNSLPVIVTYFLLGLKVILFAYLTVVERSLTED